MRLVTGVLMALLLVACITTGDVDPGTEVSPQEAALTNLRLGSEYLQRGQTDRALAKLNRAVEQDPHLAPAHAYLGLVYEQLNQQKEAGKHYKTALRLDDDDPTVRNMYAVYLCRNNRMQEAEEQFLAAATVPGYRTPETAYTNAGLCLQRAADNAKAETYFRKALTLNPRYREALWQMAKLANAADRDFQARAFLQRLSEVGDLSSQALWLGIQVERKLGDSRAADEYAEMLRAKYPESNETRLLVESMRNDGSL
ncbi:MAG: type IV pilus biogenesis/stability protein PilW [Gammaproteobacteria bacterium]|nr:type IV pilus biogenesis/stability protein PilW [Gammaproteobacteria bacterium]